MLWTATQDSDDCGQWLSVEFFTIIEAYVKSYRMIKIEASLSALTFTALMHHLTMGLKEQTHLSFRFES